MIKSSMINASQCYNLTLCPHTATSYHVWKSQEINHAIMVGTAHPSKFQEISKSIGIETDLHPSLKKIISKKSNIEDIECNLHLLLNRIVNF